MNANGVTMPAKVNSPFLGNVVEICIVSSCVEKTIASLETLGIGPFQKYEFNGRTVSHRQYRGQPSDFELIVAFATHGNMIWEIMQPVAGPSIMRDFLDTRGEGIHHVAFDCHHTPQVQRREEFERRGYQLVQSGIWHGKKGTCEFMFFDTEGAIGTCFESYTFSDDWEDPEEAT